MEIKRTKEFDLAYRFVTETSKNIFLTGKAGTGKTTFLKYLRENSLKKSVVTAPTGVASINARGVTLHSLFQLPYGIILPNRNSEEMPTIENHPLLSKIHYNSEKLILLRNLELLIIDEASMVASYTVDAIDTILRYIRRRPFQPFGGTQVLFIGDLYQLPPVVKKEEWEILQNFYSSIFFFDSHVLSDNIPVIIELTEIFRQRDEKFIEILNGIRNNNISQENFKLLNSRIKMNFAAPEKEEYITLTTHNIQSSEINQRKLNNLPANKFVFQAEINGEFPENVFPAEKELNLKLGAQVMFLKNDTEGKQYFNGKIGIITELDRESIKVKCKDDSDKISVKKSEWQNINYKIDPDTQEITEEILGSFIQYPLRLAWAITIHKSQGLTFDKIIIDAERAFAKGQVYVALSRCTSLEGLILKSPVYRNFLGAHKDFKDWQKKNWSANLQQLFTASRENYILEELQNIFTWKSWYYELKALNEFLSENQDKIKIRSVSGYTPKESNGKSFREWMSGLMEKQKEIYEISERFKQMIIRISKENSFVEENNYLQQRIKDGANYFHDEINCWNDRFINHPLSVETKKLSRKVDSSLEEISVIVKETLQKISYCKNGFLLNDYLMWGKKLSRITTKVKSSYNPAKKKIVLINTPHPELYEMLLKMRDRISKTQHLHFSEILSNNAIRNVCANLPQFKHEVINLPGLGKGKGNRYGKEIASIVREYCKMKNINSNNHTENSYHLLKRKEVSSTIFETVKLLDEGKKIEEIANARNLALGTIESHLARAIRVGIIQIEEVMTLEEANEIAEYFPENLSDLHLAPIKEKAPPEITYGKLRMVSAWLLKRK